MRYSFEEDINRGFFIFIFIAPTQGRKLPNVYKNMFV